jgi:hypothetical protein
MHADTLSTTLMMAVKMFKKERDTGGSFKEPGGSMHISWPSDNTMKTRNRSCGVLVSDRPDLDNELIFLNKYTGKSSLKKEGG